MTSDVRDRDNRAAGRRHNLCHPADIGVTHGNWPAALAAPYIGLQISEIGIPGDINIRHAFAEGLQKCTHLRLIALEEDNFDRKPRFFMKIAAHAFPDRYYLWVIGYGANPNCSTHFGSSGARRSVAIFVLGRPSSQSEQRQSEHSASDEFAQNVSRRRHDSAGMGVAKQPLHAGMLRERSATTDAHRG